MATTTTTATAQTSALPAQRSPGAQSAVQMIGVFDLMKTIESARIDPQWAAPTVSNTGYAFAALFYFICCFGMSRYSLMVERRLAAGQNR